MNKQKSMLSKIYRIVFSIWIGVLVSILAGAILSPILWNILNKQKDSLTIYSLQLWHIITFVLAIITFLSISVRYKHPQRQLMQAENFQRLSKLNELYSKLVEELSNQTTEITSKEETFDNLKIQANKPPNTTYIRNLINSISSSLDLYYSNEKEHNKYARQIFNFQNMSLQGVVLSYSNLRGANLQRTDLQRACLQRACLQGAVLQKTDLQKAALQMTNLKWAQLQDANLHGAQLQVSNL